MNDVSITPKQEALTNLAALMESLRTLMRKVADTAKDLHTRDTTGFKSAALLREVLESCSKAQVDMERIAVDAFLGVPFHPDASDASESFQRDVRSIFEGLDDTAVPNDDDYWSSIGDLRSEMATALIHIGKRESYIAHGIGYRWESIMDTHADALQGILEALQETGLADEKDNEDVGEVGG